MLAGDGEAGSRMCGRMTWGTREALRDGALERLIPGIRIGFRPPPRYNIAPTQEHVIARAEREEVVAEAARWGLINAWAKDAKRAARQINARAETVHESRAYRAAFARRRCAVPADGWYEWTGPKQARQPHWIHRGDGEAFLLAGLYEAWAPPEGGIRTTFTVLTTSAAARLAPIHDRMPLVLPPERLDDWLDPGERDPARLRALLAAAPMDAFTARAVSPRVNSAKHDDAELLLPVDLPNGGRLL